MRIIRTVLLLFSFLGLSSQSLQWAKQYGYTYSTAGSSDRGQSIALDSAGNVYATGYFDGVTDLDPGPATVTVQASTIDIILTKLDKHGNFVWGKKFGGQGSDEGRSVVVSKGYIYIGGIFADTADFDPGPGVYKLYKGGGYLCKYDLNCNLIWAHAITGAPGSLSNQADMYVLQGDKEGSVYVSGRFSGTVDFDPGPGTYTLYANPGNQNYIAKYNTAGNLIFARQFAASGSFPYTISVNKKKHIFVSGIYYPGTYDYDPGPGTAIISTTTGVGTFILKLDSSGVFQKVLQFDNVKVGFVDHAVALDTLDNLYYTGYFTNTADFDPGAGAFNLSAVSSWGEDIFVSKLDTAEQLVYAEQFGNSTPSTGGRGHAITVNEKGETTITGYSSGQVDFDPGPSTYTINTISFTSAMFILRLDSSGNFAWVKGVMGLNADAEGYSLVAKDSSILITGNYRYTNDFDPGPSVYNMTPVGSQYEIFTMKLDACVTPSISGLAGNSSICAGQTTTLSVTGDLNSANNWQLFNSACNGTASATSATGNFIITPSVTTIYYVNGRGLCFAPQNCNSVQVTVNPLPTLSITSSNNPVCVGNSVTMTGSGAASYTWTPGGVSTGTLGLTPTVTATYTLLGASSAGCTNSSSFTQSVSPCTAISEIAKEQFTVYPNPFYDNLHISIPAPSKVMIINALGDLVSEIDLHQLDSDLDVHGLPDGVYFLRISHTTLKLVKLTR